MEKPTSIYLLLATYWQRMDELTEAIRRTDDAEHDTPEREAAFAAQFEVGGRVNEAEQAIAAFRPEWPYEAKIKADFLHRLAAENNGTLEDDVTAALLSSLPALVEWRSPA